MKKTIALIQCLCLMITLSACENSLAYETSGRLYESGQEASGGQSPLLPDDISVKTQVSASEAPLPSGAASIMLSGASAESSSSTVIISGGDITVTGAGTYIISGSLENGTITVAADKSDKVTLVLNGADISSGNYAAIYVKSADKVKIELAENSSNVLSGGNYVKRDDNSVDAVIFSKDDLTFEGGGTLAITAVSGHGVVTKDDLRIKDGNFVISAEKHAFSANDSIKIDGGSFNLTCGKDGFNCGTEEKAGDIEILSGSFRTASAGDAVSAAGKLSISGGTFDIVSGGGSANASENKDNSAKGLKAVGGAVITDGIFAINSADDAVHSNADVTVSGGSFTISSGDDGFHADGTVTVKNGDINITECYEGIEGLNVDISGGNISINSDDDGINAAGGRDGSGFGGMRGGKDRFGGFDMPEMPDGGFFRDKGENGGFRGMKPENMPEGGFPEGGFPKENNLPQGNFPPDMQPPQGGAAPPAMPQNDAAQSGSDETPAITISGGAVRINANGDGIDSNGDLTVSGGEIYISGPTSSMNGAIDFEYTGTITGGKVIAAGAAGMAQNFSSAEQVSIFLKTGKQESGTEIKLLSADGSVIVSFTPEKLYECAVISSPEIKIGQTYTVTAGTFSQEITPDKGVYGEGFGGFGSFGGFGGGKGRRQMNDI